MMEQMGVSFFVLRGVSKGGCDLTPIRPFFMCFKTTQDVGVSVHFGVSKKIPKGEVIYHGKRYVACPVENSRQ